jgi:molecular chaperone IbpA
MTYKSPFDTFNALDEFLNQSVFIPSKQSFPPYDILRSKDGNEVVIEVAMAGYNQDEVDVEVTDGNLRIKGSVKERVSEYDVMQRGIARRNFQLDFRISNHLEADSAELVNGMLTVKLKRVSGFAKKLAVNGIKTVPAPELLNG